MSLDALKEEARSHERKEQWDKALAVYERALERTREEEQPDIPLFNRVGDLKTRVGDHDGALESYYEAVDLYLEAELPNNAIAICRKVIRNYPDRPEAFLRMGQVRGSQGFLTDARQNFLTYAEMVKAKGELEEAFRALIEFVELAPDDVETRRLLADQLHAHDRTDEAVEQLRLAYRHPSVQRNEEEAEAIRAKIQEMDPSAALPETPTPEEEEAAESSERAATGLEGLEHTVLEVPGEDEDGEEEEEEEAPEIDLGEIEIGGLDDEEEDEEEEEEPAEPMGSDLDFSDFSLDSEEAEEEEGLPEDAATREEEEVSSGAPEPDEDFGLEFTEEAVGTVEEEGEEDEDEGEPLPLMDLGEEEDPEPLPTFGLEDVEEGEEEDAEEDLSFGLELSEPEESEPEEAEPAAEVSLDEPADGADLELSVEAGTEGEEPEPESPESAEFLSAESPPAALDTPESESTTGPAEPTEPTGPELADPDEWRNRGERLLEEGRREEGLAALEGAHQEMAAQGRIEGAMAVVRTLISHDPDELDHHQRMVEYAYQAPERSGLVPAFLQMADLLVRRGERARARTVYRQILEVDPENPTARAVLGLEEQPASGEAAEGAPWEEEEAGAKSESPASPAATEGDGGGSEEYVDLGALVLDEGEKSTRWVVSAEEPSGDEDADFARMLDQFKEKVAENLAGEDGKAHYDLGTAYKEMGLLDEAIAEFQEALRVDSRDLAAFEMLGQCFLEKGKPKMAVRTLRRALEAPYQVEDDLVGIYYYLANGLEQLGNTEEAREFYEKVFSLDINFLDVTERLRRLR